MSKFCFENQGTHTYLVYTVTENDVLDSMSLGMITNNRIPGLAHTLFTQMDANKFIKYDVSAKISVKQFFNGQVNKKRLLDVFNGIVDALRLAEDYMIDVNSIVLDLDYIFADVSTCETVLVCVPVISDDLSNVDMGAFFKNIMFSTQFDQTENCDHVAKIINYLNSSPVFSLDDFKKLLDSINGVGNVMQGQPLMVQRSQVQQSQPAAQPTVQRQQPIATTQPITPSQPIKQTVPATTPVTAMNTQKGTPEKKISWFYLMQHYNKENAAAYKAQKAAKKNSTVALQPQKNNGPSKQQTPAQPAGNFGFAIPGQTTPAEQPLQQPIVQQSTQHVAAQSAHVRASAATISAQSASPAVQQPAYSPQVPQGQSMNFGETTVLGGGGIGETTVLGAISATQPKPHLIRVKNNEKINLDKPVFRIGKEKSYVDYFIGDNSAISRSHANIISRDGEYFVVDTNSTNHTYVNDQMIQSNVETKITHGAKIKFANEAFEFKLY